jgi:2-polyprenyl-3-methyl-5-hydroxy-6-metoxy-1,4-benzoquinol methylase
MSGRYLRRVFGRYERAAIDRYRSLFMDVDAVVEELSRIEKVGKYLEIGCGDGAISARYALRNPAAQVTGIDIAGQRGQLYNSLAKVEYLQTSAQAFASNCGERFDLIYIGDVLHHIDADADRASLLRTASSLLKAGGTLIVKEWERRLSAQYFVGWFADRVITGDKVRYMSAQDSLSLIQSAVGNLHVLKSGKLPPGRCNIFFALRKPAPPH